MNTLEKYIRGYPFVPVLLIASFKHNGVMYSLQKEESHDSFYYMKGQEVVYARYYPKDRFPSLAIKHLNHKKDLDIVKQIEECLSYKSFVKFIKEETGQDFKI